MQQQDEKHSMIKKNRRDLQNLATGSEDDDRNDQSEFKTSVDEDPRYQKKDRSRSEKTRTREQDRRSKRDGKHETFGGEI